MKFIYELARQRERIEKLEWNWSNFNKIAEDWMVTERARMKWNQKYYKIKDNWWINDN